MLNKLKNLDKCTKGEQFFVLLLVCILCFGAFCLTGCGGSSSCECVGCNYKNEDGLRVYGCSIPGIGGCLSSGRGCDSCLWPQAYKCISVRDKEDDSTTYIKAIDVQYYGGACSACGTKEKACYSGCYGYNEDDGNANLLFYGDSSNVHYIGCENGCGSCTSGDGSIMEYFLDYYESYINIK